jgi:hypothetical protein
MNRFFIISLILFGLNLMVSGQTDIHQVNFKNFTYHPYCADEEPEKIRVKNGGFSKETKYEDFTDHFSFNIFSVTYGDLTGDQKDEAVILSVCNTGGTGNFSEGFIYTIKAGKPALLARIPGGDRAIGGLREAKVENGVLVVERNDPERNQASCCSEYAETIKYRLNGSNLNLIGKPLSRELYLSQRVTFPKGAAKTTIKVEVEEIKRFRIGARAGQTLTVSFKSPNAENISLSVVEGDAETSESENPLIAKLNKTGDYIIQVQNTYKLSSEVTLTIEIH